MKLFEPGKIGKLLIKNRTAMAAMAIGGLLKLDGSLSPRAIDYYAARARGGVGLIISGIFRVNRWLEMPSNLPLVGFGMTDSRLYITSLNEFADAMHDYGAKVAIQLTAGLGRVAGLDYLREGTFPAPSVLPCFWNPRLMTREMTIEEIERLVKDFEFSAKILSAAGIDAIELHGHEGYLFDQFLTPLWNKRTDRYGGDLEGRLRLSVEVIEAIKRGAGADYPVIYRLGLTHYLEGGREVEEGLEIVRRLEAAGVDALDVDAGCYETWYWAHPSTYQERGLMVDMAEKAKKVTKLPVMAVGRLGYPELAERVLQEGKADFIILGRALLADPEWPNKVKEERLEDIRPCIGDHECLKRIFERKYISCTVNPAAGMERELAVTPAEKRKTVLVVGGGPGGMEAARVATLRGHKVILWEKGEGLGGNLIPAAIPDFKQDYKDLLSYYFVQLKKLGVQVELRKEATPELIQKAKPDVVFIATGATPIIPEIPGIEKGSVVTAIDVLLGTKGYGESVIIIGGGLVGCETALHLARKGTNVTVVEKLDSVARDVHVANRMYLLKSLGEAKVNILTGTSVLEIEDKGVVVSEKNGEKRELKTDTVVLALGLEPRRRLLEALKDDVPEVYAVGDCVEPRKISNAIWESFRTARLI